MHQYEPRIRLNLNFFFLLVNKLGLVFSYHFRRYRNFGLRRCCLSSTSCIRLNTTATLSIRLNDPDEVREVENWDPWSSGVSSLGRLRAGVGVGIIMVTIASNNGCVAGTHVEARPWLSAVTQSGRKSGTCTTPHNNPTGAALGSIVQP